MTAIIARLNSKNREVFISQLLSLLVLKITLRNSVFTTNKHGYRFACPSLRNSVYTAVGADRETHGA